MQARIVGERRGHYSGPATPEAPPAPQRTEPAPQRKPEPVRTPPPAPLPDPKREPCHVPGPDVRPLRPVCESPFDGVRLPARWAA